MKLYRFYLVLNMDSLRKSWNMNHPAHRAFEGTVFRCVSHAAQTFSKPLCRYLPSVLL